MKEEIINCKLLPSDNKLIIYKEKDKYSFELTKDGKKYGSSVSEIGIHDENSIELNKVSITRKEEMLCVMFVQIMETYLTLEQNERKQHNLTKDK